MPIAIRETDAIKLASLITQCVALKDDVLPADLEPEEIKLVVDRRRAKLLLGIENLGLQMKPDLPAPTQAVIEIAPPIDPQPPTAFSASDEAAADAAITYCCRTLTCMDTETCNRIGGCKFRITGDASVLRTSDSFNA